MSKLDRVEIRYSETRDCIVLERYAQGSTAVLEERDAMGEFLVAMVSYAFSGKIPPVGENIAFNFGTEEHHFIVSLSRVTKERAEEAMAAIIAAEAA
jgi:hypothetical protein